MSTRRNCSVLVICWLFLVACSRGASSSQGTEAVPPSTADVSSTDLTTARETWQEANGALDRRLSGGVGVSNGAIFGVLVDQLSGEVLIWNWYNSAFTPGPIFLLDEPWDSMFYGADDVQILDLNDDGNDDIFVKYHLNDFVGQVFSQVVGAWNPVNFDGFAQIESPDLSGATIHAYEKPCLPSCAEGGSIELAYSWNGSGFVGEAKDEFGNTFTLTIGPTCSVFIKNETEPYKMCDKGDAIRYLQQVLHDSDLLRTSSSNPVDGHFGPETEYSVKVFQYANHLPVTGKVDGQWYHDLIENYNLVNGIGG